MNRSRFLRAMTAGVVLVAVTTGCGNIRGELSNTSVSVPDVRFVDPGPGDAVEVAAGLATIKPFQFAAIELGTGRTVLGEELYARRPLVMLFSVPSCPACRAEAPEIAAAAVRHPDLTFVIAHSQGDPAEITAFNAEHGLDRLGNVIHLDDTEMRLWTRFSVIVQPYYVLVDERGALSSSKGALGEDGLDRAAEMISLDAT